MTSSRHAVRSKVLDSAKERESSLDKGEIDGTTLSLFTNEEIGKISKVAVTAKFTNDETQFSQTTKDARFGEHEPKNVCHTCGLLRCPGHYGSIDLRKDDINLSIYHPPYIKMVKQILSIICANCNKLIGRRELYEREFISNSIPSKDYLKVASEISEKSECENPGCKNFDRLYYSSVLERDGFLGTVTEKKNRSNRQLVKRFEPSEALERLGKIDVSEIAFLGFNVEYSKLTPMIITRIIVPPMVARPPTIIEGKQKDDNITKAYNVLVKDLTESRNKIMIALNPGDREKARIDAIKLVYSNYQKIIKGDKKKPIVKDLVAIISRLQGKRAILRGLVNGKRTDYSARTVAGPGNHLKFGEIGLPSQWKRILTRPVTVSRFNESVLKRLQSQGLIVSYRNLNGVQFPVTETTRFNIGDIVERESRDGDYSVVNRQPTLHKVSMMAYKAVYGNPKTVGDHKTICLHLSCTTPMNADYDGDEFNNWGNRSYEVECESRYIMNVVENIMSDENNRPCMGLVMNSVTGIYILSDPNKTFDRRLVEHLYSKLTNRSSLITLESRLKKFGVSQNSGPGIISSLFPSDFYYKSGSVEILQGVLISGRLTKSHVGTSHRSIIQDLWKNYGSQRTADFLTDAPFLINSFLEEDGFTVGYCDVEVMRKLSKGEVEKKRLEKIRSSMREQFIEYPIDDLTEDEYIESMVGKEEDFLVQYESRLRMSHYGEDEDDVERIVEEKMAKFKPDTLEKINIAQKQREVSRIKTEIRELYVLYEKATSENQRRIIEGRIRDKGNAGASIGLTIIDNMNPGNAMYIMTNSGAKGTNMNIAQVSGSISQQYLAGERPKQTLTGGTRAVPTAIPNDHNPVQRGFVEGSFLHGVSPTERFMLQHCGREGVTDTSSKTSETGDMHRKSLKLMENAIIAHDGTVRSTSGEFYCCSYGSGHSIGESMKIRSLDGKNDASFFVDASSIMERLNLECGYVKKSTYDKIEKAKSKNGEFFKVKQSFYDGFKISDSERKPLENRHPKYKLTKYEKARIISSRATRIENGDPPLVAYTEEMILDPVSIAEEEYKRGLLKDFYVKRIIPYNDVSKIIDARVRDLEDGDNPRIVCDISSSSPEDIAAEEFNVGALQEYYTGRGRYFETPEDMINERVSFIKEKGPKVKISGSPMEISKAEFEERLFKPSKNQTVTSAIESRAEEISETFPLVKCLKESFTNLSSIAYEEYNRGLLKDYLTEGIMEASEKFVNPLL